MGVSVMDDILHITIAVGGVVMILICAEGAVLTIQRMFTEGTEEE